MPIRVALDATPLLGTRSGVGRYVEGLVRGLDGLPAAARPRLTVTAFTLRGGRTLAQHVPAAVRVVQRPAPARVLQTLWARTAMPPVEALAGRCDVFHATNFVLPPAVRAAGVVTVHDLTFLRHPEAVTPAVLRYRELVPRSVRRAALVLCPSEATAAEVAAEWSLPADRVRATPLGVDPSWASTPAATATQLRRLGLPDRYQLFVGTREPRKQLPRLLAAHAAARAEDARVPPLVLAGAAGWGPPLNVPDDVLLLGWVDDATLRTVVASACTVVLPSRYEGFGLPLLEALACGVPVVATDLPVHREVTGDLADLVPVGDTDALAAALVRAATRSSDPRDVAARRRWAAAWTWDACARRTATAYADAAG